TTRVVGTLGYLAPELFKTGKATTSSDVYAFGALLLEVACERRPVEHKALPEEMVIHLFQRCACITAQHEANSAVSRWRG
ncbi:hypothetical protein Gorai_020182, partial [Gossypium raimondii]|nr:hypothetical protein [Gossypium raimondii]